MTLWDEYQEFSTIAKEFGGPISYILILEDDARKDGRIEGVVIASLVATGIGLSVWGAVSLYRYFQKRNRTKELVSVVRSELASNAEKHPENEGEDISDEG